MDDAMLRNVQLVQLEIAKEVKRICEQNNISYFMDGGTLLGAVRHKGFIPWDDDLDFGFTRDNYEKFIATAKKNLSSEFFLQTWDSDREYGYAFAKIPIPTTLMIAGRIIRQKMITLITLCVCTSAAALNPAI